MQRFISVANQKGGVGKTTTSVNLAADLAHLGFKTVLIDLDPQGNGSSGLGVDRHSSATIYDVLIGSKSISETMQLTKVENLWVVPANPNLIGAEVELINAISREKKLKQALKKLPADIQFVIFDCPPSLGLLTINAFTASHSILIPTQCEYYALEGLGQLLNTFQIVKENLNEDIEIEGVVLTMFDPRNKLTHEVEKELRQHFPDKLLSTHIPRNVKLSESPSFGVPIILYDPDSRGHMAYLQLAKEILGRLGLIVSSELPVEPMVEVATPEIELTASEIDVAPVAAVETLPVDDAPIEVIVEEILVTDQVQENVQLSPGGE